MAGVDLDSEFEDSVGGGWGNWGFHDKTYVLGIL